MRILLGITKSNFGGAQRYVYDLALGAKKEGHDVAVLCGGEGPLVERLRDAKIRVIPLPHLSRDIKIMSEIKSFIQIWQILKSERPEVFHINSSKMGGLGALAGRVLGVKKVIFTAHGWAFNEPRRKFERLLIKKLSWLTVLLSHKTICVSEAIKRDIEGLPFIEKKLVKICNGISGSGVKRAVPQEAPTIGTISELHRIKGLDIALRGFARAFKYTDTKFNIIGGGEERQNLEKLRDELGLESQVNFLGFRENARELLSEMGIFTLTSRSEGLPYVLLEAGLAGLPVIATNVGGISEIITHEETGLLIPKENPEALANALKRLSGDKALREKLGGNLYSSVKKNFSKERMLEKTFSLYR